MKLFYNKDTGVIVGSIHGYLPEVEANSEMEGSDSIIAPTKVAKEIMDPTSNIDYQDFLVIGDQVLPIAETID